MGITIRDVASLADVSISTVSRVLNNTCPVHPDKRERVERAIKELSYTPNPAARSLLNHKTGGIGVLLPYVSGEYFAELLTGIDETARERGYFLLISTSHDRLEEWRQAVGIMDRRADGLIVMAPRISASEMKLNLDIPIVFVNSPPGPVDDSQNADLFDVDSTWGAGQLTRHLLGLGHRHIVCLRGPARAHDADERESGYRKAMLDAGLGASEQHVVIGGYDRDEGFAAADRLFDRGIKPTAVVAANDYAAMGVLAAIRSRGWSVPGDISVTGFDNVPSSAYSVPPLTTANIPVGDIGESAVRQIVARVEKEDDGPPIRVRFPVEIVVRSSTAPPRRQP